MDPIYNVFSSEGYDRVKIEDMETDDFDYNEAIRKDREWTNGSKC